MRYLIVNADDLGLSPGVNRGILEAHERGIVTSASLMVDARSATDGAMLGRFARRLSLGLHVDLGGREWHARGSNELLRELVRQAERFVQLVGRPPSHVDSHRDVHRDPRLLPAFLKLAKNLGVPLRGHSPVRRLSKFYGQWGGESHPEQVGVECLARMLEAEVGSGVTELICHPGYGDDQLASSYLREREIEVATLCDPRVRLILQHLGIRLTNFNTLAREATSAR
jgi:predicted glycoside hydrolase/deacetylase ChbG (UPF0249 family)